MLRRSVYIPIGVFTFEEFIPVTYSVPLAI
jgi:hypothetical protein